MKIHYALLTALCVLIACTPLDDSENQQSPDVPEQGENADEDYSTEIPTQESGYDGILAADKDSDNVVAGEDIYWENEQFKNKVAVTYSGNTATVTGSSVTSMVYGADVTLDLTDLGATEVVAAGKTEDGQLKIYGNSPVKLSLEGLELKSVKSAAINVQSKSILYIHLKEDTENAICDAKSQVDESYYPEGVTADDEKRNGAIYCKGSIVLSGSGILDLTGNKKHGVSVKSSFTVRPGVTLAINDVADNCVKAEGINILGGYIWAKTTAEAGKCLSSDADVYVKGGAMKLYTTGGSIYEEDENDTSSPAGIKADGNIHITAGTILCVSKGTGGKGLNADGSLTLDGGSVKVATSGGKYVYNEALDLDSSPKGVKADGEIVINGGRLSIKVTGRSDGSEGLESKSKITVNDGEVYVRAYDDAINVGGDSPVGVEINGGKVFAFAEHNDGIDSNGKLWVNGGLVIASGSGAPEEGFDCDFTQNFIIKGGTLIGTGGAAISVSSSSTQRGVIYNGVNAKEGDMFAIAGPDGALVLRYELPRTISSMAVFFSSPDIKSGATYTVYTGGSLSGNTVRWSGWFGDGTYDAGTRLGTFTSNSLVTTVGQGGGPGGGGRPLPPPR